MSTNPWKESAFKAPPSDLPAILRFDTPGTSYEGRVAAVGLFTPRQPDSYGRPQIPKIDLAGVDGVTFGTVIAGSIALHNAMLAEQPQVGDVVRITFSNFGGDGQSKQWSVEVIQRAAQAPQPSPAPAAPAPAPEAPAAPWGAAAEPVAAPAGNPWG